MKISTVLNLVLLFVSSYSYDCIPAYNNSLIFCSYSFLKTNLVSAPLSNLTAIDLSVSLLYNSTVEKLNSTNSFTDSQANICFNNLYKLLCTTFFPACTKIKIIKPCVQTCINTWTACNLNDSMIIQLCGTSKDPTPAYDKGYCSNGSAQFGLDSGLIAIALIVAFLVTGVGAVIVFIVTNISFCWFLCSIKKIQTEIIMKEIQ